MTPFSTIISFLQDKEYRNLLITTFIVLLGGATFYHYIEGWTWLDSLYFSIITLTTIGYGDFSPQTDIGKGFTILYIIIGIGIILSFIDTLYKHYVDTRKQKKKAKK